MNKKDTFKLKKKNKTKPMVKTTNNMILEMQSKGNIQFNSRTPKKEIVKKHYNIWVKLGSKKINKTQYEAFKLLDKFARFEKYGYDQNGKWSECEWHSHVMAKWYNEEKKDFYCTECVEQEIKSIRYAKKKKERDELKKECDELKKKVKEMESKQRKE